MTTQQDTFGQEPRLFNTVYQFRAYTTRQGYEELDRVLAMQCTLYNAALQERRDGWKMGRNQITYYSQCRELTGVRADDGEWNQQNRRLATGTLKRVDLAFQAFFRRFKSGDTPGYPRFKPRQRFKTLTTHGTEPGMFRLDLPRDRAALTIKGLPRLDIKLKGRRLPEGQKPTTIMITRRGRRCTVSLGFMVPKEELPPNGRAVGLDMRMGIARVVTSDAEYWDRRERDTKPIKRRQRKLSRAVRGSNKRRKKATALAKCQYREQVSNRNAVHRFTTAAVRQNEFIAVEELDIRQMTGTARGTIENPGTEVQRTADRNRQALDQTWGMIRQQLSYKAEWAGRQLVEVDPAYTSRACSRCGYVRSSPQIRTTFRCAECGMEGAAAHNAAVNILRLGLGQGESGAKGLWPALDTPQNVATIGELSPMRVEILPSDTG